MTLYFGIDPGKQGAIGCIDEHGSYRCVVDMLTEPRDLFEYLSQEKAPLTETRVVVEKQGSMPGQGVSSSFQTGYGFGTIVGVLAATGLRYELVAPGTWKRAMGLSSEKEKSRQMARALWAEAPLSRVKDEGRCEALLLAEFLRRREIRG